jgi:phosphopantetheinyl transferase
MTKIWIADVQALGLQLDELLQALPLEDREKALRYRRAEDQLRCAAGRTMIRALAAEAGMPKAQLVFSAYGKPAFAGGNLHSRLNYNVEMLPTVEN